MPDVDTYGSAVSRRALDRKCLGGYPEKPVPAGNWYFVYEGTEFDHSVDNYEFDPGGRPNYPVTDIQKPSNAVINGLDAYNRPHYGGGGFGIGHRDANYPAGFPFRQSAAQWLRMRISAFFWYPFAGRGTSLSNYEYFHYNLAGIVIPRTSFASVPGSRIMDTNPSYKSKTINAASLRKRTLYIHGFVPENGNIPQFEWSALFDRVEERTIKGKDAYLIWDGRTDSITFPMVNQRTLTPPDIRSFSISTEPQEQQGGFEFWGRMESGEGSILEIDSEGNQTQVNTVNLTCRYNEALEVGSYVIVEGFRDRAFQIYSTDRIGRQKWMVLTLKQEGLS